MLEVKGKYNTAKVFTDKLDESGRAQIERLCNQSYAAGSRIRMMPDVHAGAGCTIGTTMTIAGKVCPNLVGVDIGCGMETLIVKADSPVSERFNPETLDACIRRGIPAGREVRRGDDLHRFVSEIAFDKIRCEKANVANARRSLGPWEAATTSLKLTGTRRGTSTSSFIREAGISALRLRSTTRIWPGRR